MKLLSLLISLSSLSAFGQKMPALIFNHIFLGIDSADIKSMRDSFASNKFAAFSTRTSEVDNGRIFTNSYIYGTDNYFEIIGANEDEVGASGLAFYTDSSGKLLIADSLLRINYHIEIHTTKKKVDDKMIPWYTVINVRDSALFSQSRIYFWLMEYRHEYFDFYHLPYATAHITASAFINQFRDPKKYQDLKRFTGMTLKVSPVEKEFYTKLFLNFGYKQIYSNAFAASDDFIFYLEDRSPSDKRTVASMEFESNYTGKKELVISKNVKIIMNDGKGKIFFIPQ